MTAVVAFAALAVVCARAEEPAPAESPAPAQEAQAPSPAAAPTQAPENGAAAAAQGAEQGDASGNNIDFEHEDTYIDISDAVRSKQYVHRAILTNLIRDTSRFYIPHFYINHLTGFSSVWQRTGAYTKYSSGSEALSLGYVTRYGHGLELGAEFSNVSNIYFGYRYFIRPKDFSLWGFLGGGYGFEVKGWSVADGPYESTLYNGPTQMGFITFGLLVPIVDVGIKAEVRFCFYDFDRIVFTQGVGIILFL